MKSFAWDPEKNEALQRERGISFEAVLFHLAQGDLLDTLEHPNQNRYSGQRIHVLRIADYAYLVPFVESESEIFLKTIIPSRKATNTYTKAKVESTSPWIGNSAGFTLASVYLRRRPQNG